MTAADPCRRRGRPRRLDGATETISARISPSLRAAIEARAIERDTTIGVEVRELLELAIDGEHPRHRYALGTVVRFHVLGDDDVIPSARNFSTREAAIEHALRACAAAGCHAPRVEEQYGLRDSPWIYARPEPCVAAVVMAEMVEMMIRID